MRFFRKKYTYIKQFGIVFFALTLIICISSCGQANYVDPHAGMVSVPSGTGGEMWVPLYEELQASSFSSADFYSDGSFIEYGGAEYSTLRGIDVSEHQDVIDWQAVHDSGVEFAVIRAGYRGYSEGKLFEDTYFRSNIDGAIAAGLEVGVYFFSQAANTTEAIEEAEYLLSIISEYDLNLPVFFDWERVSNVGDTRVDNVSGSTITDCCLAFCNTVKSAGYDVGVYFYRSLGYYEYELNKLSDLVFWVGAPGESPDFYYKHSIWQFSFTGTINGIEGGTDLNILFKETPESSPPVAPSIIPGELPPPEVTMPEPSA